MWWSRHSIFLGRSVWRMTVNFHKFGPSSWTPSERLFWPGTVHYKKVFWRKTYHTSSDRTVWRGPDDQVWNNAIRWPDWVSTPEKIIYDLQWSLTKLWMSMMVMNRLQFYLMVNQFSQEIKRMHFDRVKTFHFEPINQFIPFLTAFESHFVKKTRQSSLNFAFQKILNCIIVYGS